MSQRWRVHRLSTAGQLEWTLPFIDEPIADADEHWQTFRRERGEIEATPPATLRRQYRWFLSPPRRSAQDGSTGGAGPNIDIEDRKRPKICCDRASGSSAIVDNIPALIAIHSRSGELEYSTGPPRNTTAPAWPK